jgi:hypothetical protein
MSTFPYIEHIRDEKSGCHRGQKSSATALGIMLEDDGRFSTEMFALLDSGADYCLFPYQFLEELGIEKVGLGVDSSLGMAEGHPIYFATVTLHIMPIPREALVTLDENKTQRLKSVEERS